MAEFLETAAGIAREAGALIASYHARGIGFELKGDYDLGDGGRSRQRTADCRETAQSFSASHAVVAERAAGRGARPRFRWWYVDPLDGTRRISRALGFLMFNVTLALERAGELIAGVIYDPIHEEMFTAEKGGGAYLNSRRIRVSKVAQLSRTPL